MANVVVQCVNGGDGRTGVGSQRLESGNRVIKIDLLPGGQCTPLSFLNLNFCKLLKKKKKKKAPAFHVPNL
jgi:hypothetical protein